MMETIYLHSVCLYHEDGVCQNEDPVWIERLEEMADAMEESTQSMTEKEEELKMCTGVTDMGLHKMMIEDSRNGFVKQVFHESDHKKWDRNDPTWRPKVSHIHRITFYQGREIIKGMSVRYKMTDGSISTSQLYGNTKNAIDSLTIDCTSTFLKKIEVWRGDLINGIQIHTSDGKPYFIGKRDGRRRQFDCQIKENAIFHCLH